MKIAHKALLAELARRHANDMHAALQLARAHFEADHPTVVQLAYADEFARDTVDAIASEPAVRVAA
jgi:hypothetical protein